MAGEGYRFRTLVAVGQADQPTLLATAAGSRQRPGVSRPGVRRAWQGAVGAPQVEYVVVTLGGDGYRLQGCRAHLGYLCCGRPRCHGEGMHHHGFLRRAVDMPSGGMGCSCAVADGDTDREPASGRPPGGGVVYGEV